MLMRTEYELEQYEFWTHWPCIFQRNRVVKHTLYFRRSYLFQDLLFLSNETNTESGSFNIMPVRNSRCRTEAVPCITLFHKPRMVAADPVLPRRARPHYKTREAFPRSIPSAIKTEDAVHHNLHPTHLKHQGRDRKWLSPGTPIRLRNEERLFLRAVLGGSGRPRQPLLPRAHYRLACCCPVLSSTQT